MSDDPSPPPPVPPQRPGAGGPTPLAYARPARHAGPDAAAADSLFHQAAKAAWLAPAFVLLLGCLSNTWPLTPPGGAVARVTGVIAMVLIVAGLVCAFVAFCGVRRHGPARILAPAIVGLVLNFVCVAGVVAMVVSARARAMASAQAGLAAAAAGAANARAGAAAAAGGAPAPFTSPQSALRQTGWMGFGIDRGYTLGAMAMADPHPDTATLKSNFATDFTALVVWVDNRANPRPITVSTDGATLKLAGGGTVDALRARDVLSSARSDVPGWVAKFGPTFTIDAGAMVEGKLLFLPPGVDLAKVEGLYLTVDGAKSFVPGRVFTAEEKTRRLEQNRGAVQDPSNL